MTHFSLFSTALGTCGIAWRGDVVVATHLPEENNALTATRLVTRASGAIEGAPPPTIQHAIASIAALLGGEKVDLTFVTCDFSDIDFFAQKVYTATRAIPPGETLTYGSIALQLGNKLLAQNVGQALSRNPFPIIVPCHRVMGANGKLTGFSANGGVRTKLKMLEIEGAQLGEVPGLFDQMLLTTKL
jgi:methylated-DNA-[protein]-cysteine S-methyltransferase